MRSRPNLPSLAVLLLLSLPSLGNAVANVTVLATDIAFVSRLGRPYLPPAGSPGLGLSWLGSGVRVAHSGRVLRATFAPTSCAFKIYSSQLDQGTRRWQSVAWVPASGAAETVTIGSGASMVDVVLNMPPQYFENANCNATLLSLTSEGAGAAFAPAPPPPARVLHVLGDSITAATNIHGGIGPCGDGGYEADYSASWAGLLCTFFNASCSTIAVGGKCLLDECGGTQMQEYYRKSRMIDAAPTFDFAADAAQPPVAFISYLGTNDARANLWERFTAEYLVLFGNVTRDYYPGAKVTFVLVLGPMAPTSPANATLAAVAQGRAAGFDVVFVNATAACTPGLTGCVDGCAGHPGVGSHRAIAKAVAPVLASALGWSLPGSL